MTKYFGLTKTGKVYHGPSLAGSLLSGIATANLGVVRRFAVGVDQSGRLLISPDYSFTVRCTFLVRADERLPSSPTINLTSSKNSQGEPAKDFADRASSVVFLGKAMPEIKEHAEAIYSVSFDFDTHADKREYEAGGPEVPEKLPAVSDLVENSWYIDWLVSRVSVNDISRLRVKVTPASQEQFKASLLKRIGRFYQLHKALVDMLAMPQIETRIEDPVKNAAIAERIEQGEVEAGSFVTQDDIEKQRQKTLDCVESIKSLLDSYVSAVSSIPVRELPARLDDVLSATVFGKTSGSYVVAEDTKLSFLKAVEDAINRAASGAIGRLSV
jgi:hypothetical protein